VIVAIPLVGIRVIFRVVFRVVFLVVKRALAFLGIL
jgi:hypothetical protein